MWSELSPYPKEQTQILLCACNIPNLHQEMRALMQSTTTCRNIQNKECKLDFYFLLFYFYLYVKKLESNPEFS